MVTFLMAAGQRVFSPLSSPSLGSFDAVHPPLGPVQRLGHGVEGGDGRWLSLTTPDREAAHSSGRHQHREIHLMLQVQMRLAGL